MTEATLETIDDRPALRFERLINHPIDRVWRAVSTPSDLDRWFPAAIPWTPLAGEKLEAFGMTGEIIDVQPPVRLAWSFNGEDYSFDLIEVDGSTKLIFVHVFDNRDLAAQTATGWETYLLRLEPLLNGGYMSEKDAHSNWEEIHERYAKLFNLDPTPGRQFVAELRSRP